MTFQSIPGTWKLQNAVSRKSIQRLPSHCPSFDDLIKKNRACRVALEDNKYLYSTGEEMKHIHGCDKNTWWVIYSSVPGLIHIHFYWALPAFEEINLLAFTKICPKSCRHRLNTPCSQETQPRRQINCEFKFNRLTFLNCLQDGSQSQGKH